MRLLFISFVLLGTGLKAQSPKGDSTPHHYDSLAKEKLQKADSSNSRVNNKIDATQTKINKLLNPNLNKLVSKDKLKRKRMERDSVQFYKKLEAQKKVLRLKIDDLQKNNQSFDHLTKQLDSLNKVRYVARKNLLDSLGNKRLASLPEKELARKTDRLKSIELSTTRYAGKLDSVNYKLSPNQYTQQFETKSNEIQNKINQPASKIEGTVNEKLTLMNNEGGTGANVPSNTAFPDTQLPDASLPSGTLPDQQFQADNPLKNMGNPLKDKMGEASELKEKVSDAKGLPQQQMDKVKSIDELKSAQSKLSEADAITDKAQGYSKDMKNIAKGDLNEVKELPNAAEGQIKKLDEVKALQKETGQFDQHKELAEKAKDPKALKEEMLKQAPKLAVNQFAGKEAVLQQTMEKMEKLKSKYSEFNSVKDLPKRKPNAMKGKPFIERLTPGITFQLQRSGDVLVDYNTCVGYRFYERFTAGVGWNERFNIGKHVHLSLKDRIYGPRVFADFKIGKGFSVRTDLELMNTYVPTMTATGYNMDQQYRDWVGSAFVGLKKEYKFSKRIKGNAQFLYNLYDDHDNSPYGERLAVRMGFEWIVKKKKKTSSN